MDTIFLTKAHQWTEKSQNSINEKKYLQSWSDSLPAKLFYLADSITNIVSIPFSCIKIFFGSLVYLYTWGDISKNLLDDINNLYNYTNNSISSFVGLISINQAKSIRNQNNIKKVLSLSFIISTIALIAFSISKSDGIELYYNISEGSFEPYLHWNFSKKP